MMLFSHYVLFYLKCVDILNILMMVEKNMSFVTDDKEVYKKYNKIWEVIRKLLKFTVSPIRNDKYIIAKLKIFKNVNITTFTNNVIPEKNTHYTCISAIDIDSVLKIDKKSISASLFRTI